MGLGPNETLIVVCAIIWIAGFAVWCKLLIKLADALSPSSFGDRRR